LHEKKSKFPKKTFVRKYIRGNLYGRTRIGAKELSASGHDVARWWADFKYLESNMVDKDANDYSGVLDSNMHNEDI